MHFDSPREPWVQLPWQAPARDAAALQVLIWVWVLVTAARRGAGVFFLSPSVTMSAMLGPYPVNLQPAVVSRILSTKEGNSAVWEGGSWWREVGACEAAGSKILPDRRKLGGGNNYGTFSTLPKPYVWSYLCIF